MTVALVTGATGQDGSYLCELLRGEGVEVHALVRPPLADGEDPELDALRALVPDVVAHAADLGDVDDVARIMDDVEPTEVYNLGGISSVAFSWEDPVTTGRISGLAVAGVLQAALACQERTGRAVRVLQASSAEIFGDAERNPQDESTPLRPRNPYGAAKAYAHQMVQVYRARELHASSVVLYNHESPRRPPAFVTRKITLGAARIAAGLEHELVLGSLDVQRDWGWAPDYVRAMVAAVRHDVASDFVVATGRTHTVGDFARLALQRAGIEDWERHVRTDPRFVRPADAAVQCGDASKARRELGWEPSVEFEELVGRMVEHDLALLGAGPR